MTDQTPNSVGRGAVRPASRRSAMHHRLLPLVAVFVVLAMMAAGYFTYDIVAAQMTPCETIFRQTSVNLSTKISFLKTEGEIEVGRKPLAELDERAQMAALNLKTCCTVLDAGKLDPEQFLQCKAKVRNYEDRIENIVAVVQRIMKTRSSPAPLVTGSTNPSINPASTQPSLPRAARQSIQSDVAAAKQISRAFNKEIVDVRKAQAVETLKALPPRHVDVAAQEKEPNNDILSTNVVKLGQWITASIGTGKDADFFAFTTPPTHRDWINIEIENRSTSLEPRIQLFSDRKSLLGQRYDTTAGANLTHGFIAAPKTRYLARVSNYYGNSTGVYLLRVVATKAYDTYEPNDSILAAKPITAGQPVSASIMDKGDIDYFEVATTKQAKQLTISVRNASTTLRPRFLLFDENKSQIGNIYNTTAGGNISRSFKVQPEWRYYIAVSDYYQGAAGKYVLTATVK